MNRSVKVLLRYYSMAGARVLTIVFVLAMSGCTVWTAVLYNSYPPGATVFQNGVKVGECPVKKVYIVDDDGKNKGTMDIRDLRAEWPDGKKQDVEKITIPVPRSCMENRHLIYWNFHADVPANTLPQRQTAAGGSQAREKPKGETARKALEDLKRLRDEGILTEEEYARKRKVVIDAM